MIRWSFFKPKNMSYEIQYRLLTDTEKELFYKDFINFLSVHGIPGDEWERIKKEDKHQMMLMFAQFSDLVIHKSLMNIKYAYKIEEETLVLTQFNETSFDIISIPLNGITKPEEVEMYLKHYNGDVNEVQLPYPEKGREKYIFQLTGLDGYHPCDELFWSCIKK